MLDVAEIVAISTNGLVKVVWTNLGEGLCGDFSPSDPEDINLLRFDVSFREVADAPWFDPGDASYCTQMPVDTPVEVLQLAADHIASELEGHTRDGMFKRICEELSWMSPASYPTPDNPS